MVIACRDIEAEGGKSSAHLAPPVLAINGYYSSLFYSNVTQYGDNDVHGRAVNVIVVHHTGKGEVSNWSTNVQGYLRRAI